MKYFPFISLTCLPKLQNVKKFLLLFVVTFMKVIEVHFKVVTVVNFEKLQQDLWWHQKSIEKFFIISTTQPFCQHICFIYIYHEIECFATIRLGKIMHLLIIFSHIIKKVKPWLKNPVTFSLTRYCIKGAALTLINLKMR